MAGPRNAGRARRDIGRLRRDSHGGAGERARGSPRHRPRGGGFLIPSGGHVDPAADRHHVSVANRHDIPVPYRQCVPDQFARTDQLRLTLAHRYQRAVPDKLAHPDRFWLTLAHRFWHALADPFRVAPAQQPAAVFSRRLRLSVAYAHLLAPATALPVAGPGQPAWRARRVFRAGPGVWHRSPERPARTARAAGSGPAGSPRYRRPVPHHPAVADAPAGSVSGVLGRRARPGRDRRPRRHPDPADRLAAG